jgi:hypothetical protein
VFHEILQSKTFGAQVFSFRMTGGFGRIRSEAARFANDYFSLKYLTAKRAASPLTP